MVDQRPKRGGGGKVMEILLLLVVSICWARFMVWDRQPREGFVD